MNKFIADTKPHDSITTDYYTSALPTAKPTLLENCEEVIIVEKDLHAVGVIKDEESAKDSKDVSKKPRVMTRKGRDKEATDIETLTCRVKSLTTEMSKLK